MHERGAVTAREQIPTADEYRAFRELIEQESGVSLGENGRLTFHVRVSHRLAILGIGTYGAYLRHVLSDDSRHELNLLVCHLMDRDPVFLRDRSQFGLFSLVLKKIHAAKQAMGEKRLSILSAFTAAGEEAYTLSAAVRKSGLFGADWNIAITGMDLDADAIALARAGSYGKDSFRGIEDKKGFIEENFYPDGERFVAKKTIRKYVEFRVGSVVDSRSFAGLGSMDVVFCRGMLSHMSADGVQRAIRNIDRALSDTGYLFLSASESIIQLTNLFLPEYSDGMVLYRKRLCCGPVQDALHGRDGLRKRPG